MKNHVLLQCTKGKDKFTCYEETIETENLSIGRIGKEKSYPSPCDGRYYKEMTEHKCSMEPSIINNERSPQALKLCKSKTFSVFFSH